MDNVHDHFKVLQDEVDALVRVASSAPAPEKRTGTLAHAQYQSQHDNDKNKTSKQEGMPMEMCSRQGDIYVPKDSVADDYALSKQPGYQTDRHYSRPAYDPNIVFGTNVKPHYKGIHAEISDDAVKMGSVIEIDTKQAGYEFDRHSSSACDPEMVFGTNLKHNKKGTYTESSDDVKMGTIINIDTKTSLANPPECLALCKANTRRDLYVQCFDYVNTLRKTFSTHFDKSFFRLFYLHLKHLDKARTGWLPTQVVYDFCALKYVKFNPALVEPLLEIWNAYDGSQIKYKIFVHVINYREASPGLPIIADISPDCLEFSTTYNDMVKTEQKVDIKLMAGLPSSGYLNKKYSATPIDFRKKHNVLLSEESDAKACVPVIASNLLLQGITKQDMCVQRSPKQLREVIGAAGIIFTDEKFYEIWNEAKKFHSRGLVSYETFKRAFCEIYNE